MMSHKLNDCAGSSVFVKTTVIPCIKQHISSLRGLFEKYFLINSAQYDWVMDQFNAAGWYFDIFLNNILIYYTCILFMLYATY